jgi:hypothetical protein
MLMSRMPKTLQWSALFALALFVAWIGVGSLHQHADNPACQLCKLVHSGTARLDRPVSVPTPASSEERIAAVPSTPHAEAPSPPSLSRGPPIS